MRESPSPRRRLWFERAARVAFMFVVLNVSAVEALLATMLKKKVWRR